ncbi:TPA: hypothetical protein N0F65_007136 [Lagenidium giganteum]|uniref:Uncharacterized protein n=1 Tax=Lagenidium giganteum TaxID=4803 RepID=A0AAV2YYE3_9STRA|nr:TPA: hypothetical protein N0F65_007136 [Lagenidium giganteum]
MTLIVMLVGLLSPTIAAWELVKFYRNISVCRDATYAIPSSACIGVGEAPEALGCPKRGDVAVSGCTSALPSFNKTSGLCVARESAVCAMFGRDMWGCVFPSIGCANLTLIT